MLDVWGFASLAVLPKDLHDAKAVFAAELRITIRKRGSNRFDLPVGFIAATLLHTSPSDFTFVNLLALQSHFTFDSSKFSWDAGEKKTRMPGSTHSLGIAKYYRVVGRCISDIASTGPGLPKRKP